MSVVWSDSVNLYIEPIRREQFFINIIPITPKCIVVFVKITRNVVLFPEKLLATSSLRYLTCQSAKTHRIIDIYIVVLSIKRLLYNRLFYLVSIYHNIIIKFLDCAHIEVFIGRNVQNAYAIVLKKSTFALLNLVDILVSLVPRAIVAEFKRASAFRGFRTTCAFVGELRCVCFVIESGN